MSIELFLGFFARIWGFFLISPLFSGRSIPSPLRLALAVAFTLLLAPTFLSTHSAPPLDWGMLLLLLIKEAAIGYLIGFVFSLLIEGAAFAGQLVGTMMGLSATELLDPITSASSPLLSRFFILAVATLLIAFDVHHTFLRSLYESFTLIPSTTYPFNEGVVIDLIQGTGRLFTQALKYAWVPLTELFLVFIAFAIAARMLPDLPIFWTGFPIQLLVGILALITLFGLLPTRLLQSFVEMHHVVQKILLDLGKVV